MLLQFSMRDNPSGVFTFWLFLDGLCCIFVMVLYELFALCYFSSTLGATAVEPPPASITRATATATSASPPATLTIKP